MPIILTKAAATEIKQVMESQKLDATAVLRLGVAGGGCAGLQYTLGFDNSFDARSDAKYEQHGITVVAKKKMALHLDGTTIDYLSGPLHQGFAIENPNVPKTGGCPGCGHH
ncbi:MAG TPA: iron-sulfur cluster assembly accessory protein [Thermoguttaceae bacterium]